MKFLINSILLTPVFISYLSIEPLKATPINNFNPITNTNSACGGAANGIDYGGPALAECIGDGIEPAINRNHENIVENNNLIDSNTSNITTNTSNISTNASAIETLQGSSSSADITANTNKINTNTSNINSLGEGVAGSTALTAALSALPQMSKGSKTTCGIGTGSYSSRYAVGFGCASKVSERIDVNAGGSYVFGGSKSYGGGTLDSGVVKAGFVFKLGELNKPIQVSLNESNELKKEVKNLKAKNDKLLARLEKLENIALKFQTNSDLITMSE